MEVSSQGRTWSGVLILAWLLTGVSTQALVPRDMVIVVLSQGDSYHSSLAQELRNDIQEQALQASQVIPIVHLTHEDFPHPGAWTVFPILSRLYALHGANSSWIIFCESHTRFNLNQMLELFNNFSANEEMFIGHALHDREATIIHHFAFSDDPERFKYPHFASGFAMSQALLKKIALQMNHGNRPDVDFSIDPSHELALYIWDSGKGPALTHSSRLCLRNQPQCASYVLEVQPCADPVAKESMYFGVKTCSKYHQDRIPIVKNTWAKYAVHIGFFSEEEDKSIPTIDLGIPNTEHGHCGKTMAILRYVATFAPTAPDIKWVVIADDDTILSVARLQQLLSCFDSSKTVAIGERYGYNVQQAPQGYNYITGGGGMVFSIAAVHRIATSAYCQCPSNSTPDDMFLGICLARLGIPITHSPLFHQARPLDYAPEYLDLQLPVSFHKHWMIDPIKVYSKWFSEVDQAMEAEGRSQEHIEL
ncbi:beta-1,3-glucosyltransferase isoform X2 [Periplaneta americana]|uniref:beta-1,3-glucosyltransferase isoform X2 n=1 Tax=Periplaneta americana TaxID=6978 RepID=UPI0037E8F993